MASYKISNSAKEDLIRIHQYGVQKFGMRQADKYFNAFFEAFHKIAKRPFAYESVDEIKPGYRRCISGKDTVYFKVANNQVVIISIVGKQDLENISQNW